MSDAHMVLIEENVIVARENRWCDMLKLAWTILDFSQTKSQASISLLLHLFLSSFRPCDQSQKNGLKTDLRLPWRHRVMLSRFHQCVLDIYICLIFLNLSFKTFQKRMILCSYSERLRLYILDYNQNWVQPFVVAASCPRWSNGVLCTISSHARCRAGTDNVWLLVHVCAHLRAPPC